jgi:hypothetical protein
MINGAAQNELGSGSSLCCCCWVLLRLLQVENFGRMRYERSREALAHGRTLTQRHEATMAEVAMAAGDRPLVSRTGGFDRALNCVAALIT